MNCCLWIILLLACRGNSGFGCGNNWRNDRCSNNRCGSGKNDGCGCMNHMHDDCGCTHHDHDDCGCKNHMHDDCGCIHHNHADCNDRTAYAEKRDNDCGCMEHAHVADCGCNDNRMEYETYGCQENGIPCPPPVPGNYAR